MTLSFPGFGNRQQETLIQGVFFKTYNMAVPCARLPHAACFNSRGIFQDLWLLSNRSADIPRCTLIQGFFQDPWRKPGNIGCRVFHNFNSRGLFQDPWRKPGNIGFFITLIQGVFFKTRPVAHKRLTLIQGVFFKSFPGERLPKASAL